MLTLFVVELWAFVSTATETHIVVDQYVEPQVSRCPLHRRMREKTCVLMLSLLCAMWLAEQLRINFNITMLDLPCEFAAIDMLDVLGTNRFNVTKNIEKVERDVEEKCTSPFLDTDGVCCLLSCYCGKTVAAG